MLNKLLVAALWCGVSAAQAGTVFAIDLRAAPNRLLSFSTAAPANNAIATVAVDTFAMDFDAAGTTLYAVTPGSGGPFNVGTINTTTGAYTAGPGVALPTGITPTGLKYDPSTAGYWLSTNGGGGNQLWSLDVATGNTTLVSTISGLAGALIIDIAIDLAGNMYGHDIASDSLVSINKATGAASIIGATGFAANFAQGMDFDYDTGELFATVYTGSGNGRFVRFDLATGAGNVIADTSPWNSEMEMAINAAVPAQVPVPGTLALLGAAAFAAMRRRRH